jgi:hypothetical protein
MPYLDNEKAKVSKRKWWAKNRAKARTLGPTLPLEPVKLEPRLEPKAEVELEPERVYKPHYL